MSQPDWATDLELLWGSKGIGCQSRQEAAMVQSRSTLNFSPGSKAVRQIAKTWVQLFHALAEPVCGRTWLAAEIQ